MIKIAVIKSNFQALYDYIGQRFPVETFLTNASVGLLNSFSWPTDHLNLALHGSNEIVCVSYWGFIPKLHFKLCLILLCIKEQTKRMGAVACRGGCGRCDGPGIQPGGHPTTEFCKKR